MKCSDDLELLLEAERTVLDGSESSPLASHIQACERCAAAAVVLLNGENAFFHALAGEAPRLDPGRILAEAEDRAKGISPEPVPLVPSRFRYRGLGMAFLAAAAAVVALLFSGDPRLPGPEYYPAQEETAGLDLRLPEGTSAAILETQNPNITVLWLF